MNLKVALYVMACLHGTLHGAPHDVCQEAVIRSYDNDAAGNGVLACTRAAPDAVADWVKGMHAVQVDVFLPPMGGWRCAPRKPFDDE